MSIVDRVVEITNRVMRTEAAQIQKELRDECPRSATGHNGKHVADSFRIMRESSGAAVGISGAGFITSVLIGSTEPGAYYANYGNGGGGHEIRSTRAYDRRGRKPGKLKLKDGTYRVMVHGYEGTHFVERVADRHR